MVNLYLQQGQTPSKCEGVKGRRAVSMLPDILLIVFFLLFTIHNVSMLPDILSNDLFCCCTQFTTSRSLSKEVGNSILYQLQVMLVYH